MMLVACRNKISDTISRKQLVLNLRMLHNWKNVSVDVIWNHLINLEQGKPASGSTGIAILYSSKSSQLTQDLWRNISVQAENHKKPTVCKSRRKA